MLGNITVDEKGDFIREYTFNDTKTKVGMHSPLTQVENQRDVYKKIWNSKLSPNPIINSIKRHFSENYFTDVHRVLVVAANNKTILNTKYAPKSIKDKIKKADSLVRQIQYDLDHSNKNDWINKNAMGKWANEMNIPAYFVFTNEELDEIVKIKPKTIEELKQTNILTLIKINKHGKQIVDELTKYLN